MQLCKVYVYYFPYRYSILLEIFLYLIDYFFVVGLLAVAAVASLLFPYQIYTRLLKTSSQRSARDISEVRFLKASSYKIKYIFISKLAIMYASR